MQRQAIESSFIRAVGYEGGTLEIEFKDGKLFQYKGVPDCVFRELCEAKSAGEFFNKNILNAYEAEQIL